MKYILSGSRCKYPLCIQENAGLLFANNGLVTFMFFFMLTMSFTEYARWKTKGNYFCNFDLLAQLSLTTMINKIQHPILRNAFHHALPKATVPIQEPNT